MSIEDYQLEADYSEIIAIDSKGISIDTGCDTVDLTRRDVIAMAKHFQLTADDIKGEL